MDRQTTDTITTDTATEASVRDAVHRWKVSFEAKDVDAMMTFYAPDGFTAFDLMATLEFSGGPMWRENWVNFFAAFDGPIQLDLSGLVILPETDSPAWHASVTLDRAGYLVEHRDETGHDVKTTATDPAAIATGLTTWLGQRS